MERQRDTKFVELGRYLCETRAGQYWHVDNLKFLDEFLEKKFPESWRKAYYLMAIHEQLPRQPHRDLRQVGQKFDCATWLHKAQELPKEEFKREVERHLTGKETEPWEMLYFKVYKSQLAVIEQALETASLMLSALIKLAIFGGDFEHSGTRSWPAPTSEPGCVGFIVMMSVCTHTRCASNARSPSPGDDWDIFESPYSILNK